MKLTLAEPKYLKDSISIISDLVNEGTFKIDKEGIKLTAMDPANVAMVIFHLLPSAFTEYEVDGTQDMSINLGNLKQILRRAKPSDMLTLEVEESKLKITLKGSSTRTFSIPLIELDERSQKEPELDFPVSIKTASHVLNDAIEDCDIVAESISFAAEPKKVIVNAEGDLSKAHIEINDNEDTKITAKEKAKAKYSIEYLKKVIAGSKLSDNVSISFSTDYPLKVEYIEVDKVALRFILAPRVEND